MKNAAKELICLDAVMMNQSNAINSYFASNPGWKGLANSMKEDYQKIYLDNAEFMKLYQCHIKYIVFILLQSILFFEL